ncbi:MAG TPA: methyltransferase domain-containing protein [Acidobacteriaceae bacterium]|jgi:SAM-dependent methyltransferase
MSLNSELLRPAESYWNAAAETYGQVFTDTIVGQIRRKVVWRELERIFKPGDDVLEINCGTGLDAVFLGTRGVNVAAFDLSPRMIELAQSHSNNVKPFHPPRFRVLATENLDTLDEGPFDGAFSNFSGLNCVENLSEVGSNLARLLKRGAHFLICMRGRFVPIEIIWFLAHGRPKRAFSRLLNSRSTCAGNTHLTVHQPSVSRIALQMLPHFRLVRRRGAGITVPPSYAESLAARFPKAIDAFAKIDQRVGHLPFIRSMADCVILEFERL